MTADTARLAQIRDRNQYLTAVPFNPGTRHHGQHHGGSCIPCELVHAIGDVGWLLELVEQAPDVAEYRIGSDASYDGNDWPYIEHLPCEQDIWSGQKASGAGLNVAELLTLIAAHQCPKDGDRG